MTESVVLYIDPDREMRATVSTHLRTHLPYTVVTGETLADATDACDTHPIECVITEYHLPDGTGFELLDHIRTIIPDTGCIMYTDADPSDLPTDEAPRVADFLFKQLATLDQLTTLIETTIRSRTQTSYPIPDTEEERLAALATYDFDSESLRTALNRITDLAAKHFGVETASINIIDKHTQTFVACHGTEWPPTSREASICTYAIVNDARVTVITDTTEDPRFRDNESLQELGIRFYAGAQVITDEHASLGTLCIYDDEPRSFGTEDREYLALLADEAAHLLRIHRTIHNSHSTAGQEDSVE